MKAALLVLYYLASLVGLFAAYLESWPFYVSAGLVAAAAYFALVRWTDFGKDEVFVP